MADVATKAHRHAARDAALASVHHAAPEKPRLSTHLIEESERLFDRVVIIDRGKVVVDNDRDTIQALAFTLSGTTDAVDRLTQSAAVLRSHTVGGLKSVTVRGAADDRFRADARAAGAQLAPASLQDLVVAFGEYEPESINLNTGVSA